MAQEGLGSPEEDEGEEQGRERERGQAQVVGPNLRVSTARKWFLLAADPEPWDPWDPGGGRQQGKLAGLGRQKGKEKNIYIHIIHLVSQNSIPSSSTVLYHHNYVCMKCNE